MLFVDMTLERAIKGCWHLVDYATNLRKNNLVMIGASKYRGTYKKGKYGQWRIRTSGYQRIYERVFNKAERT